MVTADWIAIAVVVVCLLLGALIGFGRGFKFFTTGIFGVIISIVICALIGTLFIDVGFIRALLDKIASLWQDKEGWFFDFLSKINMQLVLYYVLLFIVVWVLRLITVLIIRAISKSQNKVIKAFDRFFGAMLFLAIGVILCMTLLKLVGWVGGTTADEWYLSMKGVFRLDALFAHMNSTWYEDYLIRMGEQAAVVFTIL